MHIEIWTMPDCPRCEAAKNALRSAGLGYEERSLEALRKGEILDVDAMTEAVMQGGLAPMIRVDDRFLSDAEFEAMLPGTD
jgi:glutaredoxin